MCMQYHRIEGKRNHGPIAALHCFCFRLCYAYYLRHSQFIPLLKTRYSIDQIYEGSKNETYDTITEWNFDDISVHSSLQSQIVLQLDYLNFWYDKSQLTINVSHKSLYNGIMEYYNISKEDQNILKKWLSYEKVIKLKSYFFCLKF